LIHLFNSTYSTVSNEEFNDDFWIEVDKDWMLSGFVSSFVFMNRTGCTNIIAKKKRDRSSVSDWDMPCRLLSAFDICPSPQPAVSPPAPITGDGHHCPPLVMWLVCHRLWTVLMRDPASNQARGACLSSTVCFKSLSRCLASPQARHRPLVAPPWPALSHRTWSCWMVC
jgi:hypothetical protein